MKKFLLVPILFANPILIAKSGPAQKPAEKNIKVEEVINKLNEAFYNFPQDILKREIDRREWDKAINEIKVIVVKVNDQDLKTLFNQLLGRSEDLLAISKNTDKIAQMNNAKIAQNLKSLSKYMNNGDKFKNTIDQREQEENNEFKTKQKLREEGKNLPEVIALTKDIVKTRYATPEWKPNSEAAQVVYAFYNRLNDFTARILNAILRQGNK